MCQVCTRLTYTLCLAGWLSKGVWIVHPMLMSSCKINFNLQAWNYVWYSHIHFSINIYIFFQANANYVLEIAFNSWENPLKNDYVKHCCDQTTLFPPNCPEACETRFEICLRPFNSSSNENCPYGRYVIPFDSSISDPDNFTFTLGGELEGGTPNPMTYTVPTVLSVRQNK